MDEILKEINEKIQALKSGNSRKNVGKIVALADGVARLDGLSQAMYNEMIAFKDGIFGIALNLGETEVGCIMLGDTASLNEGDEGHTTGKLLSVPVGMNLLGRVVDVLGRPLDNKGDIEAKEYYPVEKIAPGILPR